MVLYTASHFTCAELLNQVTERAALDGGTFRPSPLSETIPVTETIPRSLPRLDVAILKDREPRLDVFHCAVGHLRVEAPNNKAGPRLRRDPQGGFPDNPPRH